MLDFLGRISPMNTRDGDTDQHDEGKPSEGESIFHPDSDHFVVFSSTPFYIYPPRIPHTTPKYRGAMKCDHIDTNYHIIPSVICSFCLIFGLFHCFCGYRYFKASMFLTGFLFGSLVTYLICIEENFLTIEAKIGVAIGAGILCGLITMLVQYVGLFMTGFHLGFLISVAGLIVADWFVHVHSKWVPIGSILSVGLLFALLCLKFQRATTYLATSIIGSAMVTAGIDHFVNHFGVLYHALDRLKVIKSPLLCWFMWIVLAVWPLLAVLGCVFQCQLTGKECDHREALGVRRSTKSSHQRHQQQQPHLHQQHMTSVSSTSSHQQHGHQHKSKDFYNFQKPKNYRHLYQVRRFNGDVLSKNYVCRIHESSSTAVPMSVVG